MHSQCIRIVINNIIFLFITESKNVFTIYAAVALDENNYIILRDKLCACNS